MIRALAALLVIPIAAQDLDTVNTRGMQRASVLDQIENAAERNAFLALYRESDPIKRRSLATSFEREFPASSLLAQVWEAASRAAFELGDSASGLYYGRQSLKLYPENAMLLATMAAAQFNRGEKAQAIEKARLALEYLDRFVAPSSMTEREWRPIRLRLAETALRIAGPEAAITPKRPGRDPKNAYAGSAACESCHRSQFDAWRKSGMAKMLQPVDAREVFGDFSDGSQAMGADASPIARFLQRDGRFLVELRRGITSRESGLWDRFAVDYTIGSKWQQAFVTKMPNGELHVLPLQYNRLEKAWINYWRMIDPADSARASTSDFHKVREVTSYQRNCAPCHTSQLDEKGFAEPGVNCEMCHGPSAEHAAGGAPQWRFTKLSSRESVEICAQCHAQSSVREPQTFPPRYQRRPYAEYGRKGFYLDGRFRETTFIVESFERSACYRKGQAHCGSCHHPHDASAPSHPTSLKFADEPDRMCLQCHEQRYASQSHTRHGVSQEASRCVSCHMPKIMNSLLFSARTHQIDDRPDATATLRFGAKESPNACLLCHTDKPAAWVKVELSKGWRVNATSAQLK